MNNQNTHADQFVDVYKKRYKSLETDLPKLTVEECRMRYRSLWDGCPIELHIDDFSLIKKIENHFPDFHIEGVTKMTFTIPIVKNRSL
jgi:hypothetical protein